MLFALTVIGAIEVNNVMGGSTDLICCHAMIVLSLARLGNARLPIEPSVKRLFMDAQAAFAQPNYLKFSCALAEIICSANAHTKDPGHLLSGISSLRIIAANRVFHSELLCSLATCLIVSTPSLRQNSK